MGKNKLAKKPRGTLYLVRHAKAGERRSWKGDDRGRPLSKRGLRQAKRLVGALGGHSIDRLLTSPYVRCRQTLEPIAKNRGLTIEERPELEEHIPIDGALQLVKDLAGSSALLCSHGDVIPALIDRLQQEGMEVSGPTDTKKGSVWVIKTQGGRLVRADYLPPPRT
ncbi:MAG: histidine phosphatase family protein [Acidimicrobiia bacterium]|nr:histidine phosphatase family protein [Acidimicrobiia bacterium]MDH3398130.1 histidine phosphatase family protein [Acidimicrobiia bacterium]